MNNNEFNIQRKDRTFFTTISFTLQNGNLINCFSSEIKDVIKEYSISEEKIVDIHLSKVEQKNNECCVSVSIKYCKFDPYELKAMDKLEQIRFALKLLGYTDANIRSIKYRKYWSNSNELVWVADIYDPNYDFDPDESYSARGYESRVMNAIEEALGFLVIVDFN